MCLKPLVRWLEENVRKLKVGTKPPHLLLPVTNYLLVRFCILQDIVRPLLLGREVFDEWMRVLTFLVILRMGEVTEKMTRDPARLARNGHMTEEGLTPSKKTSQFAPSTLYFLLKYKQKLSLPADTTLAEKRVVGYQSQHRKPDQVIPCRTQPLVIRFLSSEAGMWASMSRRELKVSIISPAPLYNPSSNSTSLIGFSNAISWVSFSSSGRSFNHLTPFNFVHDQSSSNDYWLLVEMYRSCDRA